LLTGAIVAPLVAPAFRKTALVSLFVVVICYCFKAATTLAIADFVVCWAVADDDVLTQGAHF
jgi:hypothetical protein